MSIASTLRRIALCHRGTSAVEFALVAPIFIAMLFGTIAFGFYLAVVHSVQQIAAEGARASIAGLTDSERASLAQTNVFANASNYPLISTTKLSVAAATTDPSTRTFQVTVTYDAADLVIYKLPFVIVPSSSIVRSAVIQRGGY